MMPERIVAAMSGGVDSSVAAARLLEQGHKVVGIRMEICLPAGMGGPSCCCFHCDSIDARAAAKHLGIPLHCVNLAKEFAAVVVEPFVREYLQGRTPNPCVQCNPVMKFGLLFDKGREMGSEVFATGHYVQVEQSPTNGRWCLRRASDRTRDQSYYLVRLSQEQLARFRVPNGQWTKSEVRRYARQHGLPVADKPDSQEICFLHDHNYREFVRNHPLAQQTRIEPGEIVDGQGRVLGRHDGIIDFTIGQRRGLRIAHTEPLYVIALDPAANRVVVGGKNDVYGAGLIAGEVNWVSIEPPRWPLEARVQIRYRHQAAPARIEPIDGGRVRVVFASPQAAITPGQTAVFYDSQDEYVLGGGRIEGVP